jgi:hypothetical protein
MAGAYTRLHVVIEGIEFADQGGFGEVMNRFGHFLLSQFGIDALNLNPPRSSAQQPRQRRPQPPPFAGPKRPTPRSWRKTLGLDPHAPVGVREIEHAFRVLAKKLRPDRITHDAETANMRRRAERWIRVMEAREAALSALGAVGEVE